MNYRFQWCAPLPQRSVNLKYIVYPILTAPSQAHASITDWNTGFLKKSEFNADEFEDVYRGHEMFLSNIRNDRPAAYHRLMADLYKEVS